MRRAVTRTFAMPLVATLLILTEPAPLADGTAPDLYLTASLLLVVALGTPLAWWLGRSTSRLARVVEVMVDLPIVVPPAVMGIALLRTFGPMAAGLVIDGLDLMTYGPIGLYTGLAVGGVQVRSAHAAGTDAQPDLAGPRLGQGQILDLERAGTPEHQRPHAIDHGP